MIIKPRIKLLTPDGKEARYAAIRFIGTESVEVSLEFDSGRAEQTLSHELAARTYLFLQKQLGEIETTDPEPPTSPGPEEAKP